MISTEKKYGIEENEAVKNYHKNRRMFAINNGVLFIADPGLDYSHAEWFKRLGWEDESGTDPINIFTRGTLEKEGIFFYKGYDFQTDKESEQELRGCLQELSDRLGASLDLHVYGGKIIKVPGEEAVPRIDLGTIDSLLSK